MLFAVSKEKKTDLMKSYILVLAPEATISDIRDLLHRFDIDFCKLSRQEGDYKEFKHLCSFGDDVVTNQAVNLLKANTALVYGIKPQTDVTETATGFQKQNYIMGQQIESSNITLYNIVESFSSLLA